jgi:hypothetical protein
VKLIESKKDDELKFIVECEVETTTDPDLKPGIQVGWICDFAKKPAFGNAKDFVSVATGIAVDKITADHLQAAVSEKGKAKLLGLPMRVNTSTIKLKNGDPFTKVSWSRR